MNLKKISRIYHTVKYLKPIQLFYQIYYRLRPQPALKPVEGQITFVGEPSFKPGIVKKAQLTNSDLSVLNESIPLNSEVWHDLSYEKLVQYNIHYFDFLSQPTLSSDAGIHWIEDWIACNKERDSCGLEPYPISLRVVNWIKFLMKQKKVPTSVTNSLYQQTELLTHKLEYHLLANHLFANAKALIFSGTVLNGQNADKWQTLGIAILTKELQEQVLDDGGNFELSPMYHAIMLEDCLDLYNLALAYPNSEKLQNLKSPLQEIIKKMFHWLHFMVHPDRQFALFNDTALNVAPTLSELLDYANSLDLEITAPKTLSADLSASGYVVLGNDQFYVAFDAAPVGPDYQPGHAHADTLSFEVSVNKERVLVNSGTSRYGISEERNRQRSGPAHNVLQIAGADSSEVWAGFRVAKRAHILQRDVTLPNLASASHNGYHRGSQQHQHTRFLTLENELLQIKDVVSLASAQPIEIYFHVHPHLTVEETENNFLLSSPTGKKFVFSKDNALEYRLEDSTYHAEFGTSIPNKRITAVTKNQGKKELTHKLSAH